MKLLSINCRSALFRSNELDGPFITNNPDVVTQTETWLTHEVYNSEFVPALYSVYEEDHGTRGGAICIAYKSALNILLLPDVPSIECVS